MFQKASNMVDKEKQNARQAEWLRTSPVRKAWLVKWLHKNKKKIAARTKAWAVKNKKRLALVRLKRAHGYKVLALTHYGKRGKLCCNWRGCHVLNTDMLTLDHVNDDGAKHRREIGVKCGQPMYIWAVKNNFPQGLQTLCANHQQLKENRKRRLS
jgi:urocanate hydratase